MKMRLLCAVGLFVVGSVFGKPQEFSSGPHRTHLLELFTSEGCSSCPPAEAWLGQLSDDPGLWRSFVPIAWHVQYWDRLGWRDRFASREGTERQYAYAREWSNGSVYTPCFVLDGREQRARAVPSPSREAVGVLRASYDAPSLVVHFDAPASEPYDVHAVLLARRVASNVTAGENRGRQLHHDFVAATVPASAALQAGQATLSLVPPKNAGSELALAVWVTRHDQVTPLQALGGPISRPIAP